MIYVHIFKFLEGGYLVGPSLHIFKVAMLNKRMNKFIKSTYEVDTFEEFAILNARQKMLEMFDTVPNLEKYL